MRWIIRKLSSWIDEIHRIVKHISIEIRISALKEDGILNSPSSSLRFIISCAKSCQARVLVIQPTRKAERLESGVGVLQDITKRVVVNPLRN